MDVDMELVFGDEDYEELQQYFEHRNFDFEVENTNSTKRLRRERVPDIWEMEELNEKKKVSDRQQAIRRVLARMAQVSSESKKSSTSETK